MGYRLTLKAAGADPVETTAETIEAASRATRAFIVRRDLTMHTFRGAELHDAKGLRLGYVSYNGRVWAGRETGRPKRTSPLFDPRPRPTLTVVR